MNGTEYIIRRSDGISLAEFEGEIFFSRTNKYTKVFDTKEDAENYMARVVKPQAIPMFVDKIGES